MLGHEGNQNSASADSRALLLRAAKKAFARSGFSGSTVKEIADLAGVNVSLISYHFKGKEGLFRTCLEEFGKECLQDAEQILSPAKSPAELNEKLTAWAKQFLRFQVDESEVCRILYQENIYEHSFMADVFEATFAKTFHALVSFLNRAQKDGLIQKSLDPMMAASLIYGALIHSGRTQGIQKQWFKSSIADEKFRIKVVEQFVAILLQGIKEELVQ